MRGAEGNKDRWEGDGWTHNHLGGEEQSEWGGQRDDRKDELPQENNVTGRSGVSHLGAVQMTRC